jgi:hypothetical protein
MRGTRLWPASGRHNPSEWTRISTDLGPDSLISLVIYDAGRSGWPFSAVHSHERLSDRAFQLYAMCK